MGRGESSLRQGGRKAAIFTTAALPWMTGTAVNPALRAAYLAKQTDVQASLLRVRFALPITLIAAETVRGEQVTLVVPWLVRSEQRILFPPELRFNMPEEQVRAFTTLQVPESWCALLIVTGHLLEQSDMGGAGDMSQPQTGGLLPPPVCSPGSSSCCRRRDNTAASRVGAVQEAYIRQWIEKRTDHTSNFKIIFYAGRYDPAFKSIFPVGDLPCYVPADEVYQSRLQGGVNACLPLKNSSAY